MSLIHRQEIAKKFKARSVTNFFQVATFCDKYNSCDDEVKNFLMFKLKKALQVLQPK